MSVWTKQYMITRCETRDFWRTSDYYDGLLKLLDAPASKVEQRDEQLSH